MRYKTMIKTICVMLAVCLAVCGLAACGAAKVTVTVNDRGVKTPVEIETGKTVADALEVAGVTLGAKDTTEPSADSAVTADTTDIEVKRYAKVTVVRDAEKKVVEMTGGTVEDAVKQAQIVLQDGEAPDADPKSYVEDGMVITIAGEIKVSVTADGKTTEVNTEVSTVQDALEAAGVTLGKDDEVSEKLDARPTDGMKIVVRRVTYKEETKTETVDYSTQEAYSDEMPEGSSEVTQEGAEGEKTITYKVKYIDGKEDGREKIGEEVTKEPVDKIVTYGTASVDSSTDDNGSDDNDSDDNDSDDNDSDDNGSDDNGSDDEYSADGRKIVSKEAMPDCDEDGHGTYIVTYDDGTSEFVTY